MTRMLFVFGLVLALILSPQAKAASSPQDQYLRIYLLIQEAEKLEIAGQKASARERYSIALERLETLQKSNPDWESTIVKYRIKYSKDKVEALKAATDANPDQIIPPVPSDLVQGQGTPPPPAPEAPERPLSPNEKLNTSAAPMIETTSAPAAGGGGKRGGLHARKSAQRSRATQSDVAEASGCGPGRTGRLVLRCPWR